MRSPLPVRVAPLLFALLVACGGADADNDSIEIGDTGSVADCPITLPEPGGFMPPTPYPARHPAPDLEWFGSDRLWTALATDGNHSPRKSVWWSIDFPGGAIEERPPLEVTWTRLDATPPIPYDPAEPATNAYTAAEGWFMLDGIDPTEPGCWRVEATYKGASLSYVYLRN